jgi:hypothetical protein
VTTISSCVVPRSALCTEARGGPSQKSPMQTIHISIDSGAPEELRKWIAPRYTTGAPCFSPECTCSLNRIPEAVYGSNALTPIFGQTICTHRVSSHWRLCGRISPPNELAPHLAPHAQCVSNGIYIIAKKRSINIGHCWSFMQGFQQRFQQNDGVKYRIPPIF